MSRTAAIAGALAVWTCLLSLTGAAAAPKLAAGSSVLVDRETGTVLYEGNARERRPMASTTKIMTALLAVEHCGPDEIVTASPRAAEVHNSGSSLGLAAGERMRMDDLLSALLLKSANDVAIAIGEHVGGNLATFIGLMNARARELGAENTHFTNPHGLYEADHYSTAYDLALIAREAVRRPRLRALVAAKTASIERPDTLGTQSLISHNKLLWRAPFVDGVKTGYVRQSGHCLVASGSKDGWQLIAVVLDSRDMYGEALALLEYGFAEFQRHVYAEAGAAVGRAQVRRGRQHSVPALCRESVTSVTGPGLEGEGRLEVALSALAAPVEAGTPVGEARLVVDGEVVSRHVLTAGESVPRSRWWVMGGWLLRGVLVLGMLAVVIRTSAKAIKVCRRRRGGLSPQGGRPGARGTGAR